MIAVFVIAASFTLSHRPEKVIEAESSVPNAPITMCVTGNLDWSDTSTRTAQIFAGLGRHHYGIKTSSASAQDFFNQGLRLIYGFNHWEALQSFREVVRQDARCGMGYWGVALAYGPNLNDVNPTDRERLAFEAIQKAIDNLSNVSSVEADLINAMARRYDGKAHTNRDSLNKAYAEAMLLLAKKYPDNPEVLTLTADALMNTMPWNYWEKDGSAKPETQQAKDILERVIKLDPEHPGAHHLYIHLVEASNSPEAALASAKFLEDAMPASGHLVHMPSHIYIRTGQYEKSIYQNQRAVVADEEYLSLSDNRGIYRIGYYPHNIDFIAFSAYMDGRSELGLQTALKLAYKGSVISQSNLAFAQYLMVEPLHAFVRFGRWRDILSQPDADEQFLYARSITHFAKGVAFVRLGNITQARHHLKRFDSLYQTNSLTSFYFALNPAQDIITVPRYILEGEILIAEGHVAEGIMKLREAVEAEDKLRYNEPPDWKIPARHFLGAALLDAGKANDAETVFMEDLTRHRENGWALKGLHLSYQKQGKRSLADATRKRFEKAWKNADVVLPSSRF